MRKIAQLLTLIIAFIPLFACAETEAPQYVEGEHYTLVKTPVRPRDASKVEVVEIFWYACPHCYSLEPYVDSWKNSIAADVDFYQSPALFREDWVFHGRMFYAAEVLGVLDKTHGPMFSAIHLQEKRMLDMDSVATLYADFGVSREDFDKTVNSFAVDSKLKQADSRMRAYQLTGVPAIFVNGKYMVSPQTAGGNDKTFDVVNFLVEKERANLKTN